MSVPAVPPTSCVDTSHVASLSCRSLEFTAEEASRPEAPVRGAVRSQEAPGSVSGARLESTACEQQRFPLLPFLCDSLSLSLSLQPSPLAVVGAAHWMPRPARAGRSKPQTRDRRHCSHLHRKLLPARPPALPPSLPASQGLRGCLDSCLWLLDFPPFPPRPPANPPVWLGSNSQPWCWLLFPAGDAPHTASRVASREERVNHSLPPLGVSTAMSF